MSAPTVRLKIRVRLPNGSRAYLEPVLASNNKLKPLYGIFDGKPRHHPEGVYHLRYLKGGSRVWESVGKDAQVALTARLRVEHRLQAVALGLAAPDRVDGIGFTATVYQSLTGKRMDWKRPTN